MRGRRRAEPAGEPRGRERGPPAARGRVLIAVGGALLLAAAIAAGVVVLAGGGVVTVRAAPNSVAAIDPHSNRVVEQVPVGARPAGIASGSGSLWVANLDDQTVSRVDPKTLQTLRAIPVRGPSDGDRGEPRLASGWSSQTRARPRASRAACSLTGSTPSSTRPAPACGSTMSIPSGPGVVAAQGNSVWVAPSTGLLTRLNPRTATVADQRDPNASPAGIAIGDGAVWLTDSEADNVVRVDPTGLLTPIAVGSGPTAITVGGGGVWVVDSLDDAVVRIDPALAVGDGDDPGRTITCRDRVRGWVGVGRQQRRRDRDQDQPKHAQADRDDPCGRQPAGADGRGREGMGDDRRAVDRAKSWRARRWNAADRLLR